MRAMVLNDGETYTGVRGCKIVELPDDADERGVTDDLIVAACKHDDLADVEHILADVGLTGKVLIHHVFKGDEEGIEPPLTSEERELIHEGLHYLEENGAPSMGWRAEEIEAACESIHGKLGLKGVT